ncbi:FtsK/SpoIIIE domain-containing protein [Intrasporangium sp. YIM S08009]|uniref:FtsK/SpoIIIE domain-containing protein n=1 Tax=Intrasporangium zincisolvens TaxID=3080018 RepID=UPI002B05BA34|nr:FtsK/SpoIIIE domain-containing protein [Intrasporangium sp. YIM S08009]
MQLRLTIVDRDRPARGPVEVAVEAPVGATLADLRVPLATASGAPTVSVEVGGRQLSDTAVVGEPPLLHGAVLVVSDRGATPSGDTAPPSPAAVRLTVVGGIDAGRILAVGRGEHVIGRAASSGVRLDDRGISRAHAVLTVRSDGIAVRDLGPTNGSTVNGRPVAAEGTPLTPGDRLRIGSTVLALADPPARAGHHTVDAGRVRFHRSPRLTPSRPARTVSFPEPPRRPDHARAPLVAAGVPLVASVVLAWALSSPTLLLFALLSPVLLLAQWWGDRRSGRASHRQQVRDHRAATLVAEQLLLDHAVADEAERRAANPGPARLLDVVTARATDLWCRRPGDPDSLTLRLGLADQPAAVACSGEHREPPVLDQVPAVVDLDATRVVGLSGSPLETRSVAGSLLAQAATWHSPRDLALVVVSTPHAAEEWSWCRLLPHASGYTGGAAAETATETGTDPVATVAALLREVERRHEGGERPSRVPGTADAHDRRQRVDTLVVLDGASALREVPGVADLLRDGPPVGVAFLALDRTTEALPAEADAVVALDRNGGGATLRQRGTMLDAVIPDRPSAGWLDAFARALAPLTDATPRTGVAALPARVSFRDVHRAGGVDPASATDVAGAWGTSDGRPVARVGATADGPWLLDLAAAGPHALVGGTTGSGKSELLQSLVAGLAVASRPDDVSVLLVDYKGGAAFGECAGLPHVLGVVTDLDESLTRRALTSLRAELRRRERVLAAVGAKDWDDHRARTVGTRGASGDHDRLARLVIVVDEFKALADDLPEFVDGLVRIAAVGRSLGVHVVLATQRPGGIVSADMRANVSLRLCLRVRERSDSVDVIDAPDAAAVPDSLPGRGFVRGADQQLLALQTAWAGGPMLADEEPGGVVVRPLRAGAAPASVPAAPGSGPVAARSVPSELAAVVAAVRAAADAEGIAPPPSPWLPELPTVLASAGLADEGPADIGTGVVLGLADVPDEQARRPWAWDPTVDGSLGVAGGPRSGRTTTLLRLVEGLTATRDPRSLHLHVVEGVAGPLSRLAALPHVGSVTSAADPHLVRRVLSRLAGELDAPVSGRTTVLLVDGLEAVEDALADIDHGAGLDDLHRIVRDGSARGIAVAVTGGRGVLSGRVAGLIARRLVLHVPDPLDLTLAGVDPAHAGRRRPPGRAIDPTGGLEVQVALPGDCVPAGVDAVATSASSDTTDLPWTMRPLPGVVDAVDLGPDPGDPALLSLGVGGDAALPVRLDLRTMPRRLLVAGPARAGRSSALAVLARGLVAAGRPVVVLATPRSPLHGLLDDTGCTVLGPADRDAFVSARRADPDLCVVVDDVERFDGTPLGEAVLEACGLLDATDGLVVGSADLARATAAFRGLVPEIARDGHGLLLGAGSAADGDLLGARLEGPFERRAGRGHLVRDGQTVPVQVVRAEPAPVDGA